MLTNYQTYKLFAAAGFIPGSYLGYRCIVDKNPSSELVVHTVTSVAVATGSFSLYSFYCMGAMAISTLELFMRIGLLGNVAGFGDKITNQLKMKPLFLGALIVGPFAYSGGTLIGATAGAGRNMYDRLVEPPE
jgi:hypothetical protein